MSKKENLIAREIDLYTSHLESLKSILPFTMLILQDTGKKINAEYNKFIDENCKIEQNDENRRFIIIKQEHYKNFKNKSFHNKNFNMARILVPRSILVSMVSQYDAYLGRLLKAIYLSRPDIFNNATREYTFEDVSAFSSIEDFKSHAIEKEVEALLRDSHANQFRKLEDKFGLPLTKDLEIWPTFIELTERRNLFVHCDGIVSKQYLTVCKTHEVDISTIKEGEKLSVPRDYFFSAYNCLYEIGVKLGQDLWRKILPKEKEDADNNLISTTYDLIERGENDLACSILDNKLKNRKNFSNDKNYLFLLVNCAQAHKWANRENRCQELLDSQDWSATEKMFKLAAAILKDDWAESEKIMREIGDSEDFPDINYRDWPLFEKFRKREEFLNAYEQIYRKPFEIKMENETQHTEVDEIKTLQNAELDD
jgi:hypothetical protein